MKISYRWLQDYLSLNLDPQETAKLLTDCGLEVESLEMADLYPGGLSGVFVGEVITCERHPQADRLHLTTVNIGHAELPIVCGAPNVARGQKVLVATVGSEVLMGGEKVTLKPVKIRGSQSEGMICAEDELGLGTSHAGIMVLPDEAIPGTPATEYLQIAQDWIFEIGLTPNRADAASHFGVARDLAAVLANRARMGLGTVATLKFPSIEGFTQDNDVLPMEIQVIDTDACPRYCGVTMTGIRVGESTAWLKNRLKSIGLRPINNLVDISNYVLHETGQPLHFFDADIIKGHQVIIRKPAEGTPFTTLDGQDRRLYAEDLMICDASAEMCIAGVFGGIHSGVTEETKAIFIESACFDPVHIRKSSKRHGLKTDASFRFERGTDPEMPLYAMKRAALLIKELAGGQVSSPVYDVYPSPLPPYEVALKYKTVDTLLGTSLPGDHIKDILGWLDIKVRKDLGDALELEVPRYRVDVTREADVVEEILRIYGYNNVPLPDSVRSALAFIPHPDREKYRNQISDVLSGQGLQEIMCNSLTFSRYYTNVPHWDISQAVPVLNPISQELDVMRQTLLFGGLEAIVYNRNRRQADLKLFEFGNVYALHNNREHGNDGLGRYHENTNLAFFFTGKREPESWNLKPADVDFYDLKASVFNTFAKLGLRMVGTMATLPSYLSQGLLCTIKDQEIGWMGLLDERLTRHFDIQAPVWYAEFNWDKVMNLIPEKEMDFTAIPRFPAVRRDLALIVDQQVQYAALEELAYATEPQLLKSVNLFDVFEGKSIGENKKSYAISFVLQDEEKTLTDKVIDAVMNKLLKAFESRLGALLRS